MKKLREWLGLRTPSNDLVLAFEIAPKSHGKLENLRVKMECMNYEEVIQRSLAISELVFTRLAAGDTIYIISPEGKKSRINFDVVRKRS